MQTLSFKPSMKFKFELSSSSEEDDVFKLHLLITKSAGGSYLCMKSFFSGKFHDMTKSNAPCIPVFFRCREGVEDSIFFQVILICICLVMNTVLIMSLIPSWQVITFSINWGNYLPIFLEWFPFYNETGHNIYLQPFL